MRCCLVLYIFPELKFVGKKISMNFLTITIVLPKKINRLRNQSCNRVENNYTYLNLVISEWTHEFKCVCLVLGFAKFMWEVYSDSWYCLSEVDKEKEWDFRWAARAGSRVLWVQRASIRNWFVCVFVLEAHWESELLQV